MVYIVCYWSCTHAGSLIGVETPAISLISFDCFADIFVVLHFNAFVFLQLTITSFYISLGVMLLSTIVAVKASKRD